MEKNELGAEYGTYKIKERCMQASVGKSERKSPLGRPSVGGKIQIKLII